MRQVVDPAFDPSLCTLRVTARPDGAGATLETCVANGPTPDRASLPASASPTTASTIARKTVPWTCDVAGCESPSGLQNSHIAMSSGTGRPQRTHGWVGAADLGGTAGGVGGGGGGGVTSGGE